MIFQYLSHLLLNTLDEGASTILDDKLFQWLYTHILKTFFHRIFSDLSQNNFRLCPPVENLVELSCCLGRKIATALSTLSFHEFVVLCYIPSHSSVTLVCFQSLDILPVLNAF